jgi:membrane protein
MAYGALGALSLTRGARPAKRAVPARASLGTDRRSGREVLAPRAREDYDPEAPVASRLARDAGGSLPSPFDIPWSGWRDILLRTYEGVNDNRLMSVAAGVVFYGLLAIFPALAALVGLYGLFANASAIDTLISAFSGVLPQGALDLAHDELKRLASSNANGAGFVIGLAIALWSANSGTKAIIDALNVAYDEKETRSFIRLNLVSLGYTLIGIVAVMLAVAAVVVVPVVLNALGLGGAGALVVRIGRWPLLLALVIVGLALAYRFLPCRREPRWQWLSVGSVAAAVVWFAVSLLFSWYIANFGSYNATYGSLGAAVGMMTWMWISMVVILAGAELNAEIERWTAGGPAVEPAR